MMLLCVSRYQSLAAGCSGTPRKLRADTTSASPAAVKDRKHVQRAMSEFTEAGEPLTPTRAARKLAGAANMSARSIRYFVWSQNRQHQQRGVCARVG